VGAPRSVAGKRLIRRRPALHDGAQQRLVALRIELGLVEDMLEDDPAGAAARIRELEASAEEALDELRSVAHGVCPPLLADRGLREALRAAVDRSPVPVAFDADPVGRYAPEVESAVYFCLLEALQNVAKHAPGARHAVLRLDTSEPGHLRFSLRDDGPGTSETELAGGHGIAYGGNGFGERTHLVLDVGTDRADGDGPADRRTHIAIARLEVGRDR